MFDKLRYTAIRKILTNDSLHLRIERFQLRWFVDVNRMPQERLTKQTLYDEMSGKKPVGRSPGKMT